MIGTRCRVTYLDSGNVEHVVEVTADSLFEAAAALQRVEQWAQTGTVKSPVEKLRRERVRELLGLKNQSIN